ncbi:MAG: ABC transporter substrate-binding protein, partial [Achromobacter sp.]
MNRNLWSRRALAALVCMSAVTGVSAADKVKVGLLTTLSGPGSALGNEIRDGFNLALQHTGGKLGGLPAEVVVA